MPPVDLLFYREVNGSVPLSDWLDALPLRVRSKCIFRLARLADEGHALRRPEADLLRDDIYELRIGLNHVNYRILYFFNGRDVIVVSHGLVKERKVPPREIELAIRRRSQFLTNPSLYSLPFAPELPYENP